MGGYLVQRQHPYKYAYKCSEIIDKLMNISPDSQEALKLREELILNESIDITRDYYLKEEQKLNKERHQLSDPIIETLAKLNPSNQLYEEARIHMVEHKELEERVNKK